MPDIITYNVHGQVQIDRIASKICEELGYMDYVTEVSNNSKNLCIVVKKDTGIVDTFLGRWQCFDINICCKDDMTVEVSFKDKSIIDKIICFFIGLFTFLVPWIFSIIAIVNKRNVQDVSRKIVSNYIDRINASLNE